MSLVFDRQAGGRKLKGECRTRTSGNAHRPACTRTTTAATMSFQGRISRSQTLPAGRYTLLVTATAGGLRSSTQRITFTIV